MVGGAPQGHGVSSENSIFMVGGAPQGHGVSSEKRAVANHFRFYLYREMRNSKETYEMKQAFSSVFKTRSALIATYLCVCSLSIGVTLAILNVYPFVGFICFSITLFCILFIVKSINKQYWSKRDLIIRVARKNGKIHIERSKVDVTDQGGNRKLVWIRFPQHPFEHKSDTISNDASENDEQKSQGLSLHKQVEQEGVEMKPQKFTKGKDQPKW